MILTYGLDPAVFDLNVPLLCICYGLQELAWYHGKSVLAGDKKEYGHADVTIERHEGKSDHVNRLFKDLGTDLKCWMSHGDKLQKCPDRFLTIASTKNAPFAGLVHETKPWFGLQFHPEVSHTPKGTEILKNFAVGICKAKQDWSMEEFVPKEIERIRALVGPKGQVLGAVSGGVDSTVCARNTLSFERC